MNPHQLSIIPVYFSPTGTSKKIASELIKSINPTNEEEPIELTYETPVSTIINDNKLVIISMPVYGGHLPSIAVSRFKQVQGNKTPAIITVTYGNRDYEKALAELAELATSQGFHIIGASTFIGEHSYSTSTYPIAVGRPDQRDSLCVFSFGKAILKKIQKYDFSTVDIHNIPCLQQSEDAIKNFIEGVTLLHKSPTALPKTPVIKKIESCTHCGKCVHLCPTSAIRIGNETDTNNEKCIKCCACVKGCPTQARILESPYAPILSANFNVRKDP